LAGSSKSNQRGGEPALVSDFVRVGEVLAATVAGPSLDPKLAAFLLQAYVELSDDLVPPGAVAAYRSFAEALDALADRRSRKR
jgi:hypothetical protein